MQKIICHDFDRRAGTIEARIYELKDVISVSQVKFGSQRSSNYESIPSFNSCSVSEA
jgi:hypothetical protein